MFAKQGWCSLRPIVAGVGLLLLSSAAANAHEEEDYEPCYCPCLHHGMGHDMMGHMRQGMMGRGMMSPGMMQDQGSEMMGQGMMSSGMGRGRMMNRFATVDGNQDGTISADEAAAQSESVFEQIDADGDDSITEEEFMTLQMGPGAGRFQAHVNRRMERKQARFQDMDQDDDGTVTKEEFFAAAESRFQASDGNQDGQVTPWEFRMARRF